MKIIKLISALVIILIEVAYAQRKITIEDFTVNNTFHANAVNGINWMNQGGFYTHLNNNKIEKHDIVKGQLEEIIFDPNQHQVQIEINDYNFSADESKILIMTERQSIYRRSYTARYYIFDIPTATLIPLSNEGRQAYATFSPDGSKIAFTRDNNLMLFDLENKKEIAITTSGKKGSIINGSTDWVYEEELSLTKAFTWSPGNEYIAYYVFDESHVRQYNLQKWQQDEVYPENYTYKYPKAGEANSEVQLKIFNLSTQTTIEVDLGKEKDIYIPRIQWTKQDNILSVIRLNRHQNKLEIIHTNAETGDSHVVLTQDYSTYVDIDEVDDLIYLDDQNHFIISNESSGYKHFYCYTVGGKLVNQITTGDWEVKNLYGVEQSKRNAYIYYSSTEESPLEQHIYRVGLNGKEKIKLSTKPGYNNANFSQDFSHYILSHNQATQPTEIFLFETESNKPIKMLETNEALKDSLKQFQLSPKTFFEFKNSGGTIINGYMLKPNDFDVTKKYPVLIFQYSGPGSQLVRNQFSNDQNYFWHQYLVQLGYIVVVADPRGTGSRGVAFKKITYKNLGKYETEDHIDLARYLQSLDYIDDGRIGIWGWSYGGFISCLSIFKGSDYFKTAIAVSPVTNWRFYDTIYTERYMQSPEENPEGYDDNSPVTHASKLTGNFLLIHGTGDDNVHFQNSIYLQNALIEANKQFEVFFYPNRAHAIRMGKNTRSHLYRLMTNYLLKNL